MNSFWQNIFLGNRVEDWAITLCIIIAGSILLRTLQVTVLKRLQRKVRRSRTDVDDFVVNTVTRTIMPFLYVFVLYIGLNYLVFSTALERMLHIGMLITAIFFIIKMITILLGYLFDHFAKKAAIDAPQVKQANGILLIVKVVLWVIGAVFLIGNLGYDITTIVAGLGIGGIAIALAAQAVLADLFSYLVIFFDKPFETGDFIVVGSQSGIVEYIGIKTTRLRTLNGEQLIVSNTDLTNSRVQNFKRMEKRRVVLSVGVTYETSAENLKKIPGIVRGIIEKQKEVLFDRAHLCAFGNFSLNFEIVYYIMSADYVCYMDNQQAFCLALYEKFEKEGIAFAYPTQKIFVSSGLDLAAHA